MGYICRMEARSITQHSVSVSGEVRYSRGEKRQISRGDITYLFVRIFLTLFLYALSYLFFSRADLLRAGINTMIYYCKLTYLLLFWL
jgi:hypothetical protein